jgi:hypothetical protein
MRKLFQTEWLGLDELVVGTAAVASSVAGTLTLCCCSGTVDDAWVVVTSATSGVLSLVCATVE